jgi:outer membrane protein assembly factor BamA
VSDRFGALPGVGRAAEVASVIQQQIYRDYGYLHATVSHRQVVQHDPDRTTLVFQIDAGPRAILRNVLVSGDPLEPTADFQRRVGAVTGKPYEPAAVQERLDAYVERLRKKHRYQATATMSAQPSPDGTTVDLTLDLNPGPVVSVVFEGDPLGTLKVSDLLAVEQEGSADEDLIEDSARRITEALNQQGYWKAVVSPSRRDGDGALTIVFTVRKGLSYRVAEGGVSLTGNESVPTEEFRTFLVRLQPGDVFVEANLASAADAIRGVYLRLGYAGVKVTTLPAELDPGPGGRGLVRPTITVAEGKRTLVGDVSFTGNERLDVNRLASAVKSAPGEPYYGPQVAEDKEAVLVEYLNDGFTQAEVTLNVGVSPDGTHANLPFQVAEGPQLRVGHVLIVGNARTKRSTIERELTFRSGEPLGLDELLESRRRLNALGLFRHVRVAVLAQGSGSTRDVLVTVEETPANTFSYGGGLEIAKLLREEETTGAARERLEFAPRGFIDIGRRNLGGKNRSVNLYTRVSLRPDDNPNDPTQDRDIFGFSDYRVVGTYREPRAFGTVADLLIIGAVEQGVRTSFNFARKGINADLSRRLQSGLRISGRYSFSTTKTFDEQLTEEEQASIDRLFPQVRLSSFAGAVARDTRDDALEPTRGTFVSAEGTVAARALGGEVGFLKSYVQGLWFRQIPARRRIVFASRAALGLANGFPREFEGEVVDDLPASERFFAGGDSTIRGFTLDTVGTPETISPSGFPKGGNAMLLLNGELRVQVKGDLGSVFFMDGGNVFARVPDFDLGELRGAVGFGIRYKSPVGPIRLDVGYKLNRQIIGGRLEPGRAFHFSIGQAF